MERRQSGFHLGRINLRGIHRGHADFFSDGFIFDSARGDLDFPDGGGNFVAEISFVQTKIRERQEKIVSQLPPFLDLLSVSVQAGLSFDASVDRILKRTSGPLMDEFRQMQKDLRLGLSKKEALQELAGRCDLEDIYLFTTSVIQSERLGASMVKTLIEQAKNMRERYQQRIKAKALKAPIKILFPLVLLIFPTIFIIILLPPILNILANMNIMPG